MHQIRIASVASILIIGLVAAPAVVRAAKSYDNCTGFVDSVPATISTQGTWCLRQDLTTNITSGVAIQIRAHNVTLDCNDFKIGGLAAGTGTSTNGIAAYGSNNTTVQHCNVRGFFTGVDLRGYGHTVEDNRLDGNTGIGIQVLNDYATIQRNQVRDTGSSTYYGWHTYGISTNGIADIRDNTVSGVFPLVSEGYDGAGYGIHAVGYGGSISGNRVRDVHGFGNGAAIGIYSFSDRASLVGNHISGDGSAGSIGLKCSGNNNRAVDNVINGFATTLVDCRDDGNSL